MNYRVAQLRTVAAMWQTPTDTKTFPILFLSFNLEQILWRKCVWGRFYLFADATAVDFAPQSINQSAYELTIAFALQTQF